MLYAGFQLPATLEPRAEIGMVKGIVLFAMSKERYQRLLDWWFDTAKEQSWRVWGLLMLVLGVVILSWL